MDNNIMILTDRLILRKFEKEDYMDLYAYLSDEAVVKYEPYGPFSREQAVEEARRRANDERFFAVCIKDELKVIGNLFIENKEYDCYELGYVFSEKYQGYGFALESTTAMLNYVFYQKRARRVIAQCNPLNQKSWHLLENLGMTREAHLKKNVYFKLNSQGEPLWCDTYIYAILKSEWEKKRQEEML